MHHRRLEELAGQVERSVARRQERLAGRPPIRYDQSLPIHARRGEIAAEIADHPVVIVSGDKDVLQLVSDPDIRVFDPTKGEGNKTGAGKLPPGFKQHGEQLPKPDDGLEVLRLFLFRGDPEDVRAEAAMALGEVGEESDIELLKRAARDKKGLVRQQAVNAIEKLNKKKA